MIGPRRPLEPGPGARGSLRASAERSLSAWPSVDRVWSLPSLRSQGVETMRRDKDWFAKCPGNSQQLGGVEENCAAEEALAPGDFERSLELQCSPGEAEGGAF